MRKSGFSEEQVAYPLRQAESGTVVADAFRQLGVGESAFYLWKKKYGDLQVSDAKRLRALEDENARLKRLVADQALNLQILRDVVGQER